MRLALIAAVARNGVIGHANDLLWRLPEDLQHFRATTLGHAVIMGRKTWDSLPARWRPLAGRTNIVLTRQAGWAAGGALVAHTLGDALAVARVAPGTAPGAARVFVIGGAELYALALPRADELLLTEIARDFEGDTRFPPWPRADFEELARTPRHAGPPNDFDYAFVAYRRRAQAAHPGSGDGRLAVP